MTDQATDDPDHIDDPDNPEMTADDFARARPFAEVFPQIAAKARNLGGRPPFAPEDRKVRISVRVAPKLAAAIEALGQGHGPRVEAVLQQAHDEGRL